MMKIQALIVRTFTGAALLAGGASSWGAVQLNELFINVPGTDDGYEFFELKSSTPSESLSGLWFLAIEGDGSAAGTIDLAFDLSAFSTGSNGLFLWRDNSANVIDTSLEAGVQGPDTATIIASGDFNPDIENGSNTYLLVRGFTGAIGNALDANADGALDATLPWTAVVDSVSMTENDTTGINLVYADDFAGTAFPAFVTGAAGQGFNPDALIRTTGGTWIGGDVLGTNPGPYEFDGPRFAKGDGTRLDPTTLNFALLTPGRINPTLPSTGGVVGDYNNSGTVEAGDYSAWVAAFGTNGPLMNLSPTKSGTTIDASDYTVYRDALGTGAVANATAVPEPGAMVLLVLGVTLMAGRRER